MALLRSSQRELLLYLYEAESFKSSLFLIMFDIELLRDYENFYYDSIKREKLLCT